MKLIWITDPHLNFLSQEAIQSAGEELKSHGDALLITGDISESPSIKSNLQILKDSFKGLIYFILGNHDFYNGSFSETHKIAREIHQNKTGHWLRLEPIELNEDTILVGSDGFYDARCGVPYHLEMNDFFLIKDLAGKHIDDIIGICRAEADSYAFEAKTVLDGLDKKYKNIYFATHYPPFPKSCFHLGGLSGPSWQPFFVSIAMGTMLADFAFDNKDININVFAGHTHSSGIYNHSNNLIINIGSADYGNIIISRIINV